MGRHKWLYPNFYMKHYELWPVLILPVFVTSFAIFTAIRTAGAYDVRWTKRSPEQWERLHLLINPTLRKLKQNYEIPVNKEAYYLYKDMYEKEPVDREKGQGKKCVCKDKNAKEQDKGKKKK